MKQTVHNISNSISNTQNLRFAAGSTSNNSGISGQTAVRLVLALLAAIATLSGMAQTTFTTRAAGNWSSAATWEGGVAPSTTIAAGRTINIKHSVLFDNATNDLNVNGTLYVLGDSLRFNASYDKKVNVSSTGLVSVRNGGFLQIVSSSKSEMIITGGRIALENAVMLISKNMKATAGAKRSYKNSTLIVGEKYETEGSLLNRSIDSVVNSYVEAGKNSSGFEYKANSTLRVSNATMIATKGDFLVKAFADVSVLPNAAGNFGFDLLKANNNLENGGTWDARVDGYCVGKDVKDNILSPIDFTSTEDCGEIMQTGQLPEMSFVNPVLKSGIANKEGAVYRFSNVTSGVDAEVTLKKFSRSDIVMQSVDLSGTGWEKAFQPQFGLNGWVAPYQNWYVDFEMAFYKAGTNVRQRLSKTVFTALDVDGDGYSIGEYATFANPSSAEYSPITSLGNGEIDILDPIANAGALNTVVGTVQNFFNIDTAATQVMATFTYLNKDKVTFRYGARSGSGWSNGSGMRLNSLWAKPFSLDTWILLPVGISDFTVMNNNGNAVATWKTPTVEKVNHFIVQRSIDGKTFTDIATVLAGETINYSFTDKGISSASGLIYYRVVTVDKTKETSLSPVKMIRLSANQEGLLTLATYPNPAVNDVRITLPNAWQGKAVTLQLYTANGTIAKSIQLGSASQTETMALQGLTKGMYIVKAVCGTEVAQQRLVKN